MVLISAQGAPVVRYEENGTLLIKGQWISENIRDFSQRLSEWGSQLRTDKLVVEVDLDCVNENCSGYLSDFFRTLDTNNHIHKMVVNWYYEMGLKDSLLTARMLSKSLHKARFKFCLNTDGM